MKIAKKAICLFLCVLMTATLFVSCGDKGGDEGEGEATGATELTMWCIATESDANHEGFVKAVEAFNASHDDIELKWEAFENESYKTKVKAAAQAGELPDIYFSWSGAFLGDFANAGAAFIGTFPRCSAIAPNTKSTRARDVSPAFHIAVAFPEISAIDSSIFSCIF